MKKLLAGMLVVGMALVPILGMAAGVPAPTPLERATKAAANAEAIYQQAKDLLAKVQQEVVLAAADEAKAKEDLKIAIATGDKTKINAAKGRFEKATRIAKEKERMARELAKQVERLKMIAEKAKMDVTQAGSPDPKVAQKAAADAEALAAKALQVERTIKEIMKPHHGLDIIGVTIPSTTTSTTKPSPTPVGQRG